MQTTSFENTQLSSLDVLISLEKEEERYAEYLKQPFLLGPLLHGVIMETIASGYAEHLHNQSFNPFSQYVTRCTEGFLWSLRTLTCEATKELLEPIGQLAQFKLKKLGATVLTQKQTRTTIGIGDLTHLIHKGERTRFKLTFLTPTAFKSKGIYQTLPNLHLIYQNLIQHYSLIYEGNKEADPEAIDYLASHTKILSYNLSSKNHLLGTKRIPGFLGSMTVEIKGPQSLTGFAHMLFRFSEYGGIGIKTSLGMGGVRLA